MLSIVSSVTKILFAAEVYMEKMASRLLFFSDQNIDSKPRSGMTDENLQTKTRSGMIFLIFFSAINAMIDANLVSGG